jgi:hypothetical protein
LLPSIYLTISLGYFCGLNSENRLSKLREWATKYGDVVFVQGGLMNSNIVLISDPEIQKSVFLSPTSLGKKIHTSFNGMKTII